MVQILLFIIFRLFGLNSDDIVSAVYYHRIEIGIVLNTVASNAVSRQDSRAALFGRVNRGDLSALELSAARSDAFSQLGHSKYVGPQVSFRWAYVRTIVPAVSKTDCLTVYVVTSLLKQHSQRPVRQWNRTLGGSTS